MTDLTIIVRSMRARLFSTVTTIITTAVAVALMLIILTMKDAGKKAFERGSGDMHLFVTAGGSSPMTAVLNGIFYANMPRAPLSWEQYRQLSSRAPWAYAIPTQQGDTFHGQPVLATTTDFFSKFRPNPGEQWELASGAFFTKPFELVVGSQAASAIGLEVGDRINLVHGASDARPEIKRAKEEEHDHDHAHDDHDHDHAHDHDEKPDGAHIHEEFEYTVVGILKPTGGSHDRAIFTDLIGSWIIHAHDRRERESHVETTTQEDLIESDKKITGVYLRLITRDGSDTPANLPQVFDSLRRDGSLTVAQPKQEIDGLFRIVGNIDRIFIAIAGVVMLSSGIAIMLALYNSMEQRRRQIAVLRVLGASQGRVFGLVLTESVFIGLLGCITGIALGLLGAVTTAQAIKSTLHVVVSPALPAHELIAVSIVTVVLSAIAGLIPAIRAYRTSVAENLRPLG